MSIHGTLFIRVLVPIENVSGVMCTGVRVHRCKLVVDRHNCRW